MKGHAAVRCLLSWHVPKWDAAAEMPSVVIAAAPIARAVGRRVGVCAATHVCAVATAVPVSTAMRAAARCTKMALVHDLAESIVGDITPADPISPAQKSQMELDAMRHIAYSVLGGSPAGVEMLELWQEFEAGVTAEARLVKDLDKFDMLFQAFEYEVSDNRPGELEPFFTGVRDRFVHPQVRCWMQELDLRRAPRPRPDPGRQ